MSGFTRLLFGIRKKQFLPEKYVLCSRMRQLIRFLHRWTDAFSLIHSVWRFSNRQWQEYWNPGMKINGSSGCIFIIPLRNMRCISMAWMSCSMRELLIVWIYSRGIIWERRYWYSRCCKQQYRFYRLKSKRKPNNRQVKRDWKVLYYWQKWYRSGSLFFYIKVSGENNGFRKRYLKSLSLLSGASMDILLLRI